MSKKLTYFIIFNILLIVGSIGYGMYVRNAARRYFAPDVLYIAPRANHAHLHFNASDLPMLSGLVPGYTIAAESLGSATVFGGSQWATTAVIYCDRFYFRMHFMNFIDGWHWYAPEDMDVIVLNEALAWRLFGSLDVVGMLVQIDGRPHKISGVVSSNSEYMAWVPRSLAMDLPVTALFLTTGQHNPLSVYDGYMLLTNFGRNPNDYAIVDINRYIESMAVRHRVLLYIVWFMVLAHMTSWGCESVKHARDFSKDGIKVGHYKPLIGLGLLLACIGISAYIIFGVRGVIAWLPNPAYENLFSRFSNIGVLPPIGYLPYGLRQLARLNTIWGYVWAVGVIGLVNVAAVMPNIVNKRVA